MEKPVGPALRDGRIAKDYSLRKFADPMGVGPTYLSQAERADADPPIAERVGRMAGILGENADELTALAAHRPPEGRL